MLKHSVHLQVYDARGSCTRCVAVFHSSGRRILLSLVPQHAVGRLDTIEVVSNLIEQVTWFSYLASRLTVRATTATAMLALFFVIDGTATHWLLRSVTMISTVRIVPSIVFRIRVEDTIIV